MPVSNTGLGERAIELCTGMQHGFVKAPHMISLDATRAKITAAVGSCPAVEMALEKCLGAVLAADIRADADYPSADRSMMDGYVVRADAQPGEFRIAGEIAAGEIPESELLEGEAMRIFTGALLPTGGARVVMQEECQRAGETVTIKGFSEPLFIRKKASEAQRGDAILTAGTRIGAAEMAILAQVGCVNPKVFRKPTVLHLATGEELVAPEHAPETGQIRDSNSSLIRGLIAPYLLEISSKRTGDDLEEIFQATQSDCDLLLISGGASVGDHDHGVEVLRKAGFTIHFDQVNLRPGKPLTFATKGRQVAFVIPGNPVSHFACFHAAIRLAIEHMCGLAPQWNWLDLEISSPEILRPNPRETLWPARVEAMAGRLVSVPQKWSTSGNTFSIAACNALIRVNEDQSPRTLLLDLPHPGQ